MKDLNDAVLNFVEDLSQETQKPNEGQRRFPFNRQQFEKLVRQYESSFVENLVRKPQNNLAQFAQTKQQADALRKRESQDPFPSNAFRNGHSELFSPPLQFQNDFLYQNCKEAP